MSLYDALEVVGEISSGMRTTLISTLGENASLTNTVKVRLQKGEDTLSLLEEVTNLKDNLTPMQYDDLRDRL